MAVTQSCLSPIFPSLQFFLCRPFALTLSLGSSPLFFFFYTLLFSFSLPFLLYNCFSFFPRVLRSVQASTYSGPVYSSAYYFTVLRSGRSLIFRTEGSPFFRFHLLILIFLIIQRNIQHTEIFDEMTVPMTTRIQKKKENRLYIL